jgi:hypothetical protein
MDNPKKLVAYDTQDRNRNRNRNTTQYALDTTMRK